MKSVSIIPYIIRWMWNVTIYLYFEFINWLVKSIWYVSLHTYTIQLQQLYRLYSKCFLSCIIITFIIKAGTLPLWLCCNNKRQQLTFDNRKINENSWNILRFSNPYPKLLIMLITPTILLREALYRICFVAVDYSYFNSFYMYKAWHTM